MSAQIEVMRFLAAVARMAGVAEHIYIVGGAVRNFVLDPTGDKYPIKDVDVVVDSVGLKGRDATWFAHLVADAIPVDVSVVTNNYGVAILTVKGDWSLGGHELSGEIIEIAGTRKESYGDNSGYKPQTVEPATIQEDVLRREFTLNSLLWRLHDLADGPDKAEILDLSGCGLRDLRDGTLRCPNDPDIVFSDDPSRMVRAIKFLLKYGFKIAPDVAASIRRNARKLKKVPPAHLSTMLVRTFFEPGVGKKALLEMDKLGLLDVVREIAQDSKDFMATLNNWADRKAGLDFLYDLLDLQMPMGKRLSVIPHDLAAHFRAYAETEPEKALALLDVLDQPGRKFDMPGIIHALGVRGAEIKGVTNTIRRLLVLNPDLTEADLYRKLIQGRATQTAAISDKHIDFNLARKGSGMNKVAQAVRVAARWALMKNAATSNTIIERVAARPITPEKLKELMLKIRKGSTASLNIKQVQAVIEAIGGKLTPSVVLASPAYPLQISGLLDEINGKFPLYKSKLVPRLPSNPKIGEMYVTKVENPSSVAFDDRYSGFLVHYYRGVEEFTIKIPENDDVKVLPFGDHQYIDPNDIFQVLNKKTDFISRVNAYLGTKEHVPARDRTRDQTGSCPVCFKNVKLSPRNTIVLHGYTRPGYGQVEGNCPGVGKPPFEISSEGSSDYLRETLEPEILYLKKEIKRLRSGKVTSFLLFGLRFPGRSKTFNIGDPGWDTYLEKKITEEERSLGNFTQRRDVFKTLIQNWKIRPLPKEGEAHINWFVKGRKSASLRLSAADKYSHIDFKPPKSVADAAEKGLEYREKASPSNKGGLTPAEASKQGIGSGVQRAVNLKNLDNISPDVIRQMVAFFARHQKNKSIAPENKSTPWNDKGYVAWLIWGGDPGKAWAEKVRDQMDAADKKAAVKKAMLRYASEGVEPPQILRTPYPATLVLRGVADLNDIASLINRVLPRISLDPTSIPKPKSAGKAYSFHWSNAQAKWDVIPVRAYPTSTDGSEFMLFIPKGVMNPVYEGPWTLRDMQVVARRLNPHPAARFGLR